MHVSVEYNQKSFGFFFSPVFVDFPDLQQTLQDDFARYKDTGALPDYFGRDTAYDRPDDIKDSGLMHIHLCIDGKQFDAPPKGADLRDPKTVQWYRTSNTALVYAQNLLDENSYSLIALFHPVAHFNAQNYDRMRILAAYAREFRDS